MKPVNTTALHIGGAVVREDGRLLATRRADNGTSEVPSGVLELAEAQEKAVVLKVWEETGTRVEADERTGVYNDTTRGIVALVFLCKLTGGTEYTSDGSTAVEERVAEAFPIRLLDALDGAGPQARSQDGRRLLTQL